MVDCGQQQQQQQGLGRRGLGNGHDMTARHSMEEQYGISYLIGIWSVPIILLPLSLLPDEGTWS